MAVPSNRPQPEATAARGRPQLEETGTRSRRRPEATYAELAPRLQAIVARNVNAPEALIEDACQIAWASWTTHRDRVSPNSILAWLATTAIREALRLLRKESRYVPLNEDSDGDGRVVELPLRAPGPEQLVEFREKLAEVRHLPVGQQRALWMRGLGYDYREIAAQTGASERAVERNLLRARRGLRLVPSPPTE